MNKSKIYAITGMGTHCFEVDDVKEVHLSDIQNEEPNGFHAAITFVEEVREQEWRRLFGCRSKRSIERENKRKRRNKYGMGCL